MNRKPQSRPQHTVILKIRTPQEALQFLEPHLLPLSVRSIFSGTVSLCCCLLVRGSSVFAFSLFRLLIEGTSSSVGVAGSAGGEPSTQLHIRTL